MKNKATKFVAIFSLCALCLGGYAVSRISAGEPAVGDLPVEHLLGDFAIDVNDPYEVVGFADYYFLATVDEAVTTSYRNEATVESETGGTRSVATPYTDYSVTVVRNIKRTLPVGEPISITKAGGVSQDGKSVVVYEDDMLLEPRKTYAMTASVQEDGTLLISGPNSCEVIENNVNAIDSGEDVYDSYYANEVEYDRERFDCIYAE